MVGNEEAEAIRLENNIKNLKQAHDAVTIELQQLIIEYNEVEDKLKGKQELLTETSNFLVEAKTALKEAREELGLYNDLKELKDAVAAAGEELNVIQRQAETLAEAKRPNHKSVFSHS